MNTGSKRRYLSLLLLSALLLSALPCVPAAAAATDYSQSFDFILTGDNSGALSVGDILTVTLTLRRTDKAEEWAMYAWQTEIAFDNSRLRLVSDSVSPASGVGSSVHTGETEDKVYFNAFSLSRDGSTYPAELEAGSFRLQVIAAGGTSVRNTNYLVSTAGGAGQYAAVSHDLTLPAPGTTVQPAPAQPTPTTPTPQTSAPTVQFEDVEEGDWFEEAVGFVVRRGLFQGMSDTKFSPQINMTRSMLVTVLWRLEGEPAPRGSSGFADVENGAWYTDAVAWANENHIVEGYGDGYFGTQDDITREQMAAILYRYSTAKGYLVSGNAAGLSAYADADRVSGWAADAMAWANAAGLITGRTEDTLVPDGFATRAEVATILMRYCGLTGR